MRKLTIAAFSFSGAVFLSRYLLPYEWGPFCCALSAAAALCVSRLKRGSLRLRALIGLTALAAGFLWFWAYTAVFLKPLLILDGATAPAEAVITGYPNERTRGYSVDAIVRQEGMGSIGARLYYYNDARPVPGDIVTFTAKFQRTDGFGEEERFDALSSKGAFLCAFVSGDINITGTEGSIRYLPLKLSNAIAKKAEEIFPDDVSPLMSAMLTGNRDALNRNMSLNISLSASGIAHVVAISGMHVSFIMGFFTLALKNKKVLALAGIPALTLFMAMCGFTPSVSRAGLMQILLICAPVFGRESDGITSLSASLLVLLAVNPYACASAGLQLSFAATLGIILFSGKISAGISDRLRHSPIYRKKPVRAAAGFLVTSLATTVGSLVFTLPLSVLHFGYISLISPITNLLTLWVVSIAFPIGLVACVLGFISAPLGAAIAFPAAYGARYVILMARTLSSLPYCVVYSSNTHIIIWLAYIYVMFVSLPLMRARARQYLYPACLGIISLIIALLLSPIMPGTRDASATVLDVGQGLCVVLSSGKYTAVVDCGSISGEDAGAVAHEFLQNEGRTSIDLLILTHFHEDHVSGVGYLLSRASIGALAIADPEGSYLADDIIMLARKRGVDIIYVTEIMRASLGELDIVLYPPMDSASAGDMNERGLAVLTTRGLRALITGDLSAASERGLLRTINFPQLDLLVAGHHGSRTSTSEEIIHALRPSAVAISVGRNSFGHPSPDTLDRLERNLVPVYRTDESGHLRFAGSRPGFAP